MTRTRVHPVLVTGATGRVGRAVIDQLVDAGVPVRALTHRSEAAATPAAPRPPRPPRRLPVATRTLGSARQPRRCSSPHQAASRRKLKFFFAERTVALALVI